MSDQVTGTKCAISSRMPTRDLGFPAHRTANLFAALPVVQWDPAFGPMQQLLCRRKVTNFE